MILDEVLQEDNVFTEDSMVDMFVEGFLYALEMQEEGKKAQSIEELSNTLSEAANEAISELSDNLKAHAAEKARLLAGFHDKNYDFHYKQSGYKSNDRDTRLKHAQAAKNELHKSNKKINQAERIEQKLKNK